MIIVASVSCIYGLGSPQEYGRQVLSLRPGMRLGRDEVIAALVDIHYERNEIDLHRGTFRVRGDVIEIVPASFAEAALRVEFFGDEIERLREVDLLAGRVLGERSHAAIFPATHYVTAPEQLSRRFHRSGAERRLAELRRREAPGSAAARAANPL